MAAGAGSPSLPADASPPATEKVATPVASCIGWYSNVTGGSFGQLVGYGSLPLISLTAHRPSLVTVFNDELP